MTILITGGTGKTGTVLAKKLHDAGHSVLLASRSGSAPEHLKGVKFDWFDPSTFENPFNADGGIDKVYLLGPRTTDVLAALKPFIDLAVSKGVKRFVLLSATSLPKGGHATGKVHEYLDGLKGIDYGVLRPTWFFENFETTLLQSIRDKDELVTATQDGKVPLIAVDDITDVAFDLLTTAKIENPDVLIVGPDLLTYDQAAEILSGALGRKINHRKITGPELAQVWKSYGAPDDLANMLVSLNVAVAEGKEEKVVEAENKYVGKLHLVDWVEQRKYIWNKA
ncbi:NAD(P)-binding protein [Pluteus cervinus]|uniref:NAD(P)-binding protein n=1 Tax=Pluteus cervinus TaxID=181527 RepID=A0ACD3A9S4_9AGAR|nr:NAD(P)-binding protein [Pluteus cervinus]